MSDTNMPDVLYVSSSGVRFTHTKTKHPEYRHNAFTMPTSQWQHKYIRADLAPTQSAVDVDDLKFLVHKAHLVQAYNGGLTEGDKQDIEDNLKEERYAYQYGGEESVDWAIDYLNSQGYLRTPEPTTDEKRVMDDE